MATLHPFRALRPNSANASRIAAVPYDVVSTDEARALADGNPMSFLRVSRAEIELPAGTDPYADAVYKKAADNFAALRAGALTVEDEASVYFYRLQMGGHVQTGLAACFSIDEYDRDIIKKHERTRRDKEDDRTKHMLALGAQTGPVFLTYRAADEVDRIAATVTTGEPIIDFTAPDEVRHTLWRVGGANRDALVAAVHEIPALYIADGHHRAASAARARAEMRDRKLPAILRGECLQHLKQYHRIHATGDGDEDFLPVRKQSANTDFVFEALEEFAHAAILLFFGAAGKRLAQKSHRHSFIARA